MLTTAPPFFVEKLYVASRSLPLALICLLAVLARSRTGLVAFASVMVLMQAGDAIIGDVNHDT